MKVKMDPHEIEIGRLVENVRRLSPEPGPMFRWDLNRNIIRHFLQTNI